MTVWKFRVPVSDQDTELSVPKGRIVAVGDGQAFPEGVCFWVEFDRDAPSEPRVFRIFGTGHEVPSDYQHLGTVEGRSSLPLVWHLYERIEAS